MLQKTIERNKRKNRKLWYGYHERKTPTKAEKLRKTERKYRYAEID